MRRIAALLSLALLASLAPAASRADAWEPRAATYTAFLERDVFITMSDGVRLAADVIRPALNGQPAPGKFPVLVTQTPYNKLGISFRTDYMVTRGYVQVIAEVRGTGSSAGTWDSFGTREQLDGREIVEWAARQEWSDGNIGLHGTSYGAINQLFTAAQFPDGRGPIDALFPIVPMADAYRDITGSGGQVNTSFIPLWLGLVTGLALLPPTWSAQDPVTAASVLLTHIGSAQTFQAPLVATALAGGENAFDGPLYRQRSPIEVIDRVAVPTFLTGGWYDLFQRGTPMLYERLSANGVPARLVMGPWYHVNAGEGWDLEALELRWMDHYVRGVPDAALDADIPPVQYIELGSEEWKTSDVWPPAGIDHQEWFLSGTSSAGGRYGTLVGANPAGGPDVLAWTPGSGACSRSVAQWTANGSYQGCEVDQRSNDWTGLAYDLAVPADGAAVSLAGPVSARLYVETTARDAFITARLEDVSPDGRAEQISAGWQLVSMRALDDGRTLFAEGLPVRPYHPFTRASALPVRAGEVYEVWVEIFPTAAKIAPGHSLRLSIQPSDAPHLTPPAPQAAALAGGVLTLHHDAERPSAVVVPVSS